MDRFWFFTWRTYGTWLPGKDGFVGYYAAANGKRVIDNRRGELPAGPIPRLEEYSRAIMAGEPVLLERRMADVVLGQLKETATFRGWVIDAVAIMANHVHVVYGVPGDPDPSAMLRDWKSYASRALNRSGAKPAGPRWWADQGSKRRLKDEDHRVVAIRYVRDQPEPLLVWLSEDARRLAGEPAASAAGFFHLGENASPGG
jgi:REP element-mobilizing transposase RayT